MVADITPVDVLVAVFGVVIADVLVAVFGVIIAIVVLLMFVILKNPNAIVVLGLKNISRLQLLRLISNIITRKTDIRINHN